MKRSQKFAVGLMASVGLGLAVAAHAYPGQMGSGMGPGAQGGMQHGAQGGMQHGTKGGMSHGAMGDTARGGMGGGMGHGGMGGGSHGAMGTGATGPQAGQQLMTPEERTAIRDKMRSAATPEERQKIAEATRTEMEKRAKERGVTLPEHRGPRAGAGFNAAPAAAERAQ